MDKVQFETIFNTKEGLTGEKAIEFLQKFIKNKPYGAKIYEKNNDLLAAFNYEGKYLSAIMLNSMQEFSISGHDSVLEQYIFFMQLEMRLQSQRDFKEKHKDIISSIEAYISHMIGIYSSLDSNKQKSQKQALNKKLKNIAMIPDDVDVILRTYQVMLEAE